jgi:hypothetical protein
MAVKRHLPPLPSNPNKKAKVEVAVSVEELKESFANKSEKSGTVVLGRKTFDLALLGSMADILLEELPSFEFAKEDGEEASAAYSIVFTQQFSEEQMRLLVDKLELNGAACVLYGEKQVRMQGFVLWSIALKLIKLNPYLKTSETKRVQSLLEKRVYNGKKEAETIVELNSLLRQRRKHWNTEAILKTKRILTKRKSYPNFFVFETVYISLLQGFRGWSGKKLSHDNVFTKVLFFIEICNQHLLKKKMLEESIEEIMRKVLEDLPTVLQAPSANLDNLLICLSFATRFHINTLKKGQEEGLALQVLRSLLTKIVRLNRNSLRTKKIMTKYFAKLSVLLPSCLPTHYVFKQLQCMEADANFQREEWLIQLNRFLRLKKPVSGVKSLVCMTASSIKASANGDCNLLDLPNELKNILKLH